ncbi:MAG: hypothetical protein Q7K54_02805 [Candidatus Parcubacteria bacterium]|nr:hypothetical protein [Candidatus Parcubacteria bacterium]
MTNFHGNLGKKCYEDEEDRQYQIKQVEEQYKLDMEILHEKYIRDIDELNGE